MADKCVIGDIKKMCTYTATENQISTFSMQKKLNIGNLIFRGCKRIKKIGSKDSIQSIHCIEYSMIFNKIYGNVN